MQLKYQKGGGEIMSVIRINNIIRLKMINNEIINGNK
jgi:hypothetical protein